MDFIILSEVRILLIKIMSSMKNPKPIALSPTKENQSPTRHTTKNHDPVTQLLGYIKAAGLKLPSHIEKSLHQESGPLLKIIPTEQTQREGDTLQKMKIRLGDTEFELKKLEEDFAQFKLSSRQEKEKQVKKWEEAYNNIKNTLEYTNQDSSLKLLRLRQSTQREMAALKEKHEAEIKQQKQKITKSYEQKISSMKKLNERQIRELKQNAEKQLEALKEKSQTEIKQLKETHETELRKLSLKNKEALDAKQKQFQSIYTAIQSEKKTEEKLHEKTRIEASQAKQKLYSELYFERNVKKDLEDTIQAREADIKALKSQIHDLEIDIILLKQKAERRETEIKKQFQVQRLGIEQLHKESITQILQTYDRQLKKYQKSIQQLHEWKQHKETLLQQKYEQIESKFDERPSRQQDLDMIEKLKSRMMRKQEQVRLLNKELKICVLESENKEETYNKIFTSNTMNKFEKKCLSKDRDQFKSKDSLCRKSQTTDIKFLLKVYNKHI